MASAQCGQPPVSADLQARGAPTLRRPGQGGPTCCTGPDPLQFISGGVRGSETAQLLLSPIPASR